MKKYKFEALIKKHPKLNSAFIEFPYSVEEEFATRGQVKVKAQFDEYIYRGSLAKMGHHCHILGLNQEMRKAIGKEPGDRVQVILQKDDAPRIIDVPVDLKDLLDKNEQARTVFDKLSYTHKKEYVEWIVSAKKEETRQRRLKKTLQMLAEDKKHP